MPAIVQVEPLTTARALRGPFDYLRPEGAAVGLGAPRALRAPRGPRGRDRPGRRLRARRRRAPPAPRRRRPAAARRAGAVAGRRHVLDARAGALAPAAAARARGRRPRCGPRPAGRRPRTSASPTASARCSRRCRARPAPTSRPCGGWRPAGSSRSGRAPCAGPRGTRRSGRAGAGAGAHRGPGGRAAGHRAPRRPASACCCTASPARARPRSTCGRRAALAPGRGAHRARARDRADAADRRALLRALRRHRGRPALAADRRRAPRRVDAAAPRRGARLRRPALGRVRADGGPRPGRRRRGARRLLQARGRPALRRPPRSPSAARCWTARCSWPAAPRRGPRASTRCGACACPARRRRARCRRSRSLDMRGRPRRAAPADRARRWPTRRKAIVLLNRRGWSNFLTCRTCGHVWSCPSCDVTLVLAPRPRASSPATTAATASRCPAAARRARRSRSPATGRGPSACESELAAAGPPVFRLDADVADARRASCSRFERADRGVLVGTQMVAKGHDFPDVDLGVVLDADATLRFPDFRAEERTFALVAQLAGRAGRAGAARRPGARPDARARRAVDRARRPP